MRGLRFFSWSNNSADSEKSAQERKALQERVLVIPFRDNLEHSSFSVQAWLGLGIFLRETHKYEEANDALKKAVEMCGNSVKSATYSSVMLEYGRNCEKMGDREKAIECYNKVKELEFYPDRIDAIAETAWAHLGVDDCEKAKIVISELENTDSSTRTKQMWCHLTGNYHLLMGDNNKALQYYKQAVEMDGTCVDALAVLGELYNNQKDYKKAKEHWNRAFEIDPYNTSLSHYKLAKMIFTEDKDYYKCKTILETALQIDGEDANSHFLLGASLDALDVDPEKALYYCTEAVRLGCCKKDLFLRVSSMLEKTKNYEGAIGALNTGMKRSEKNIAVFLNERAGINERRGEKELALIDYETLSRFLIQSDLSGKSTGLSVNRNEIQKKIAQLKK